METDRLSRICWQIFRTARNENEVVRRIEEHLGEALVRRDRDVFGSTVEEALSVAGTWLDVPKAPKFTDIDEVASGVDDNSELEVRHVFPVDKWTQAYTSYSTTCAYLRSRNIRSP